MNKKIILIVVISILLVASLAEAKNVALVVKNKDSLSEKHEKKVYDVLNSMGHNIILVDKTSTVGYKNYDLIVVAGRPGNTPLVEQLDDFVGKIPVNEVPTIAIDSANPAKWGWLETGGISTTSSSQIQKMVVVNNSYPITSGYNVTDEIFVHTLKDGSLVDIKKEKTAMTVLTSIDKTGKYGVVAIAEPNTHLSKNITIKARIVFFGVTDTLLWTDKTESLFKTSVDWATSGTVIQTGGSNNNPNPPSNQQPNQPLNSSPQALHGSSTKVPSGGGNPIPEYYIEELVGKIEILGLSKTFEIEVGKSYEMKYQIHNGLNATVTDVDLSFMELFPTNWYIMVPDKFDSIAADETKDVSIIFNVPEDAEIYTYPLTLRVITHSKFGIYPYFEKFNVLLMEPVEVSTTTTTTTLPQEKPTGLTGLFVYAASNPLVFGIGLVAVGMIFLIWKFYPHPLFGKKGYVWKKR